MLHREWLGHHLIVIIILDLPHFLPPKSQVREATTSCPSSQSPPPSSSSPTVLVVVEVGRVEAAEGPGGELGQESRGAVAVQHAGQVLCGGVLPLGAHR